MAGLNDPSRLDAAFEQYRRQLPRLPDHQLLQQLVDAWGNPQWSAWPGYLSACLDAANRCKGPILECGSGLTTLLLAEIAARRGQLLWSLEHQSEWRQRMDAELARFGLSAEGLCHAPLREFGDFHWYDPSGLPSDTTFSLVICDGPPGRTTPGGRFGLVPILRNRFASDCRILLDDGDRQEEREIARRWGEMLGVEARFFAGEKGWILLDLASGKTPGPNHSISASTRGTP